MERRSAFPTNVMYSLETCTHECRARWLSYGSFDTHCAPLERGAYGCRNSIDISLLWSERRSINRIVGNNDRCSLQMDWEGSAAFNPRNPLIRLIRDSDEFLLRITFYASDFTHTIHLSPHWGFVKNRFLRRQKIWHFHHMVLRIVRR